MTKIVPRGYQIEAVEAIWEYFRNKTGNPLVVMPTATGKGVVIAMFLQSVFRFFPRQKVLVVTHVKELVDQNYIKLMEVWPTAPAGINSAGLGRRDLNFPILFAGVASVVSKIKELGHVDLILIDEAHLVSPSDETMYGKLVKGLKVVNPYLKVIGFTATPWRLGHGKITDNHLFTDLAFNISTVSAFNRLIAEGFLAPLVPRRPKTRLDLDGVHIRGGDFVLDELQHAVDKEVLTRAAIREAIEYGEHRKRWLIFCSGIDHAEHTSAICNEMGIECRAIHSRSPNRDVDLRMFKEGRLQALTNNNVLTTGIDVPEIDMIIMLRPTMSPVLWVQMLGRGTRISPGKENCLVLDFAGNTARLGPINDPIIPGPKGSGGGTAPVKLCPKCDCYVHASARWCNYCQHEFIFDHKLTQQASEKDLITGEIPVISSIEIDNITYSSHKKQDKPPTMKVSYYCGLNKYDEYVCFEHDGFAKHKARQWWGRRSAYKMTTASEPFKEKPIPMPPYVDEALTLVQNLPVPTHLKVLLNKKFPEILDTCFDGTNFNTQTASDAAEPPEVVVIKDKAKTKATVPSDLTDDDIPF